jgi:hypothetical protein
MMEKARRIRQRMDSENLRFVGLKVCQQMETAMAPILAHPFLKSLDLTNRELTDDFSSQLELITIRCGELLKVLSSLWKLRRNEPRQPAWWLVHTSVYLLNQLVAPATMAELLKRPPTDRVEFTASLVRCISSLTNSIDLHIKFFSTVDFDAPNWRDSLPGCYPPSTKAAPP